MSLIITFVKSKLTKFIIQLKEIHMVQKIPIFLKFSMKTAHFVNSYLHFIWTNFEMNIRADDMSTILFNKLRVHSPWSKLSVASKCSLNIAGKTGFDFFFVKILHLCLTDHKASETFKRLLHSLISSYELIRHSGHRGDNSKKFIQ